MLGFTCFYCWGTCVLTLLWFCGVWLVEGCDLMCTLFVGMLFRFGFGVVVVDHVFGLGFTLVGCGNFSRLGFYGDVFTCGVG